MLILFLETVLHLKQFVPQLDLVLMNHILDVHQFIYHLVLLASLVTVEVALDLLLLGLGVR